MTSELADHVSPPLEEDNWLGFPPASETEITELESRLGLPLPPSYRAFLMTTNGWRVTTPFIFRVRPASEVDWYVIENEHSVWLEESRALEPHSSDPEYYQYPECGSLDYRADHMPWVVQISDVGDGVYLLNPQAVTPDGEWEAWFFASWNPGADRYPSFAHLLLRDYESFRRLENVQTPLGDVPFLPIPSPDLPRVPAPRTRNEVPAAASSETLITQMESIHDEDRTKAAREFSGKMRGRPHSSRRPDLVEPLTELFYRSEDGGVRAACVQGLVEFAPNEPVPGALFDALWDPDAGVVMHARYALHYFPDARALEPLCRFIESNADIFLRQSAVHKLGEMADPRALPSLMKVLLDTTITFDQSFQVASHSIAQCGPRGIAALTSVLDHPDPRVREAAAASIEYARIH